MKDHFVSPDMIVSAQQLRLDLGYTQQDIVDEAEKIGMPVAMSTVKRFFAKDAVNHRFAVETVQGIFAVLGHTNDKTAGATSPDQVDFLKEIIAFDRQLIADLDAKIAENQRHYQEDLNNLRCTHSEQIYNIVSDSQKKLEFVKSTIEEFKKQIEVKDRRMDQRDTHFMQQIDLKDRRYDDLLKKYDALLERYTALKELGE